MVPAFRAHVVVRAQLVGPQCDPAARAVRGKQDLGELAALDRNLFLMTFEDGHHSERPPSTAMTWPVMKPARSEQRNPTAAPISSAVPSRLTGVILTSSLTIASVREPVVSSVRTCPGATASH